MGFCWFIREFMENVVTDLEKAIDKALILKLAEMKV